MRAGKIDEAVAAANEIIEVTAGFPISRVDERLRAFAARLPNDPARVLQQLGASLRAVAINGGE